NEVHRCQVYVVCALNITRKPTPVAGKLIRRCFCRRNAGRHYRVFLPSRLQPIGSGAEIWGGVSWLPINDGSLNGDLRPRGCAVDSDELLLLENLQSGSGIRDRVLRVSPPGAGNLFNRKNPDALCKRSENVEVACCTLDQCEVSGGVLKAYPE